MTVIDVGHGATTRASASTTNNVTRVDLNNPANATGSLDTMETYAPVSYDMTGFKCGTFYGSGTDYTSRDYESIGNVTSGSKQTFTGLSCDVESGDFLGYIKTGGRIYVDTSGYDGAYNYSDDAFDGEEHTYTLLSGDAFSIYATGATASADQPFTRYYPHILAH